jgi:hypothetical protein
MKSENTIRAVTMAAKMRNRTTEARASLRWTEGTTFNKLSVFLKGIRIPAADIFVESRRTGFDTGSA